MAKTAVVILNWNGETFLKKFLPIVIKQTPKSLADVIVADNASTDGSVAMLRHTFPDIRIIQNSTNGGFAKGYNKALEQVSAEYYVLLNSDVEVTENWLEPVIRMMDTDQTIAAAQPKIRSWHRKAYFEYAGAAGGFIDQYGYPFCRGRIFQHLEKDIGQYDDETEIFWATGACMFVRAKAYHELGGLDEDFFAHMEEIDFCWRLKQKGYKIMYQPDSVVYHVGGGTLPKASSFKTYLNIRNNNAMLFKNLPRKRLKRTLLLRLLLDGVAALKFMADGGTKDLMAVVRAHQNYFRMLPKLRQKRRAIQPREISQVYRGNIVVAHYIKQIQTFSQLPANKFR